MPVKDPRECRIQVGHVVVGLICPSADDAREMERYFGVQRPVGEPHISLRYTPVSRPPRSQWPDSLFATKRVRAGEIHIAGDVISGRFSPTTQAGEFEVDAVLTHGHFRRVLEQFLYQAFYSARRVCGYDALLLHSSSVIRDGAGFVFVGASGTGKSTVARLSSSYLVLNDEISLISFEKDGVFLNGNPFNGYFRGKSPGRAPLKAILLLKQAPLHRLSEVGRSEAVVTLMPQIVPPVGLEEELTPKARATMLEWADRLSCSAPVRRLEFLPDPGFWKEIDHEFCRTPGGGQCPH